MSRRPRSRALAALATLVALSTIAGCNGRAVYIGGQQYIRQGDALLTTGGAVVGTCTMFDCTLGFASDSGDG